MKKGKISTTGYRANSKDKDNAFNIIPSNRISMRGVRFPVFGVDNMGNQQMMYPGREYTFPGQFVTEYPQMQSGGRVPIMVDDPSDPRLHAYQDSLNLWKGHQKQLELNPDVKEAYINEFGQDAFNKYNVNKTSNYDPKSQDRSGDIWYDLQDFYTGNVSGIEADNKDIQLAKYYESLKFAHPASIGTWSTPDLSHAYIKPIGNYVGGPDGLYGALNPIYKKPIQPIKYSGSPADVNKYRGSIGVYGKTEKEPFNSGLTFPAGKPVSTRTTPDVARSVSDNLTSMGMDNSFAARKQLAEQAGFKNYTGTAEQNVALNTWLTHKYQQEQTSVTNSVTPTTTVTTVTGDNTNTGGNTTTITEPVYATPQEHIISYDEWRSQNPLKQYGGNFNAMKKVSTKGIAYPQQPTAQQFFQMTFNPNDPKSFYRKGGDVPCYDCGGMTPGYHMMPDGTMMADQNMKSGGSKWIQGVTKSIEQRGTKGRCTGSNFGSSDCPPGSPQYNLAVTFRNMAKKQFGGSSAPQNADSDSIIDNRRNTMQNFLSQNTMRALALDEADQMAGAFMQMGGNFGFDPNMYGQSMYADAVSQGQNQMHKDFGDFFNSGMNLAMTTNPYEQLKFKRQGGPVRMQSGGQSYYGSFQPQAAYSPVWQPGMPQNFKTQEEYNAAYGDKRPYTWTDVQQNQQAAFDAYFDTYDPNGAPVNTVPANTAGTGYGTGAAPITRPKASGYGTGYSQQAAVPSGGTNAGYQPNYADECETLFNTQAEVDECVRQKKGLGTSQTPVTGTTATGPRTGNYIAPQNNIAQPGNQGNYIQQPDGTLAFISGQQPYGYFPMNNNPYYKMKGKGPMWGSTGAPNIAYNPNNTFLKDYEYKGRLFGQGPRKVTMTFQHGVPTAVDESGNVVPQQGTGTGVTTPNQPNQNFDAYLQQNVDPDLYSKVLNGTATQDEFMEFNDQKMQLENQFQNSRMRQIPAGLSPDVKPSLKNRFANFQQSNQERGNRRGFRRTPPRESGVHPGFANPSKQYGGSMEAAQAGMLQPSVNAGDESTVIWKRKMGLDPENAVAWGLTGMDMLSSFGEAQEKRRNEEMLRARMNADALFQPLQFGDMSRGDYETNTGMFRPDQNVPVQFQGQNFGQIASGNTYKKGGEYQNGGEYYLTDAEIAQIKRMGGQIQFLD